MPKTLNELEQSLSFNSENTKLSAVVYAVSKKNTIKKIDIEDTTQDEIRDFF